MEVKPELIGNRSMLWRQEADHGALGLPAAGATRGGSDEGRGGPRRAEVATRGR